MTLPNQNISSFYVNLAGIGLSGDSKENHSELKIIFNSLPVQTRENIFVRQYYLTCWLKKPELDDSEFEEAKIFFYASSDWQTDCYLMMIKMCIARNNIKEAIAIYRMMVEKSDYGFQILCRGTSSTFTQTSDARVMIESPLQFFYQDIETLTTTETACAKKRELESNTL